MSDEKERAELLAALHAAGAASEEDEKELQALLEADPALEEKKKNDRPDFFNNIWEHKKLNIKILGKS